MLPLELGLFHVELRRAVGLKLESSKGPVEVWVIDHVEKLSED